jgi:GT2 family glycosyltransferase
VSSPTVTVLCPISQSVSPQVFQSAVAAIGHTAANGAKIEYIGVTERTLIESARNILSREFLKTKSEWSFWLDSDMIIPPDTICRLLNVATAKNAKMVTGIYYQRGNKYWPVCWIRDPKLDTPERVMHMNEKEFSSNEHLGIPCMPGPEAKEPFLVDTAGFGCCLIHRNVFEATEDPWFQFLKGKCSEDFYFFVQARKKGFKLWADPSLRIGHEGAPKIIYREDCYEKMQNEKTELKSIKAETV